MKQNDHKYLRKISLNGYLVEPLQAMFVSSTRYPQNREISYYIDELSEIVYSCKDRKLSKALYKKRIPR